MAQPKGMGYYMPLTSGCPKDGPSTSVFSVPKVQYSRETEAVVKNLMRESRLTFTQKNVFNTILRGGKPLPERPEQIMMGSRLRQSYMQQRHHNKARSLGLQLLETEEANKQTRLFPNYMRRGRSAPGRRSLDSIKASGDLEPSALPKSFIPPNKEIEKERLANQMAFGKTGKPPETKLSPVCQKITQSKPQTVQDLKEERFGELINEIQDRMQFFLSMNEMNKGKEYKACIVSQINEKLQEMQQISEENTKDVRDYLKLELVDERLGSNFANSFKPSKLFD